MSDRGRPSAPSHADAVSRATALLLPLLALPACAPEPTPSPAASRTPQPASPPPGDGAARTDPARGLGGPAPKQVELPEAPPRAQDGAWTDDTEGPAATLVYVTRMGSKESNRAAAIVFSSDPRNAHFQRTPTPRINVKRLRREQMGVLLEELEAEGLEQLPWEEQDYDAEVGPERGLYLYRDGTRRRVLKDGLPATALRTFTQVERILIDVTVGDSW